MMVRVMRRGLIACWLMMAACGDDDSSVDRRDMGPDPVDAGGTDARPPALDQGADDAFMAEDGGPGPVDLGQDGGPADAGDCTPGECCYRQVEARPGVFHMVVEGDSRLTVRPLASGEGFFCMRVEYTMALVDNLAETTAAHEGCPIYSHMADISGTTSAGRVLNAGYFRFLRLGCGNRRPAAVEINAWGPPGEGRFQTLTGPWLPTQTYRIVHEVYPHESTIELFQDGVQVGRTVATEISGTTVDMSRDPEVGFGLTMPLTGAFFPYYDAVYSDLEIWAHVAP